MNFYSGEKRRLAMPINKEWHLANKMPANPTHEERMEWHIEHLKHCDCRKPTGKLAEELASFSKG